MTDVPEIAFNNGETIPQIGLGVFLMKDKDAFMPAIQWAIDAGYRHFDTAAFYGNEQWLGEALKKSDLKREDVFLTSKVWNSDHGYEETKEAFEKTLSKLGTDYLDLYLIHWPADNYIETWKAMEELYKAGKIKSIGVSNFKEHHLDDLMEHTEIKPVIDQIETHPYFQQSDLVKYLHDHEIAHEAWSPLGRGSDGIFEDAVLKDIAAKHHKTVAQVILRWHLQRQTVIIPKSTHKERIEENFNIFDFELTNEEMNKIATLDTGKRIYGDPDDKEWLAESASTPLPD
ncbi:aldo/keto reductase [Companilactobacillus ginsenosidimutans]|uniref:Glyoxal reductase n=1 Tax=Companilactobacillus ginsenosidimutans TaxID=1007676 RepID=A0A0H4QK97_9LACO|nr:aldo/keto reductase [Companilactobacillus ginsenosidimutans]AKP67113.1 glyoxal reductase [Companilactobacillus ginsenosidimutans]